MNCPQCGAASQEGRDECPACGIVFARWRPRERKPPPPAEKRRTSSADARLKYWVAVPVASMLVLFAVMWAAAVRQRDRHLLAQASRAAVEAGGQAEGDTAAAAAGAPAEEEIREQIEACSYFQDDLTVTLPKTVSPGLMRLTAESSPGVVLAANMGLIEFDPPFDASQAARYLPDPTRPGQTSVVTLGTAAAGLPIFDAGNEYRMELGRRRVETITNIYRSPSKVTAVYRWTVGAPELVNFAPDHQFRTGGADFANTAEGWVVTSVWINTYSAARIICSGE